MSWDDYLDPDPRERSRRAEFDEIRAQITQQEHIVTAIELALETARDRLKDLHKQHAAMILADAYDSSEDGTKM